MIQYLTGVVFPSYDPLLYQHYLEQDVSYFALIFAQIYKACDYAYVTEAIIVEKNQPRSVLLLAYSVGYIF